MMKLIANPDIFKLACSFIKSDSHDFNNKTFFMALSSRGWMKLFI